MLCVKFFRLMMNESIFFAGKVAKMQRKRRNKGEEKRSQGENLLHI